MQIPILQGIYTDEAPDFRAAFPRNMVPVPKSTGLSSGYLRPGDGIKEFSEGPGLDRGGINGNGVLYRVMGTKFVSIDAAGAITEIGDVGTGQGLQCSLDQSFDYVSVSSAGNLFHHHVVNDTFGQVLDPDLGPVIDFVWIDGHFMTTDGEFLVVTELNDPFAVLPLKYGSSEIDPDPVVALEVIRNEVYAVNRYTVEIFDNIGGNGFPFQRRDGAQLQRGGIGTHACIEFMEALAFVGSGKDEEISIYIGANGTTTRIADREIDKILKQYTEEELALVILETRKEEGHESLYVKLPDQTLVYDGEASRVMQRHVWTTRDSGLGAPSEYRAFNFVYVYNKWICGDPTSFKLGEFDKTISTHYGDAVSWNFSTMLLYNGGQGAIIHKLELVTLPGRIPLGPEPVIFAEYTEDGRVWSNPKPRNAGGHAQRKQRIEWRRQGRFEHWRAYRFHGTSEAHIAVARLEANFEALAF